MMFVLDITLLFWTDYIKFLTEHDNFDGNAEDIVFQLDELNLSDFYENPLTLKLLAHINIDNLPDNRADIFSLAIVY